MKKTTKYIVSFLLNLIIPTLVYAQKIEFSQEELEFIQNSEVLTVAFLADMPPMSFTDENSKAQGLLIDYIGKISEKSGLKFKIIQDTWSSIYNSVLDKEIDFIGMIKRTPERDELFDFTRVYLEFPAVIVSRNDRNYSEISELNTKILALNRDSYFHQYVVKNFPDVNIILKNKYHETLNAILKGEANAAILDISTFTNIVQRDMLSGLSYGDEIEELKTSLSMASAKDNTILVSILDKTIESIKDAEMVDIKKNWIHYNDNSNNNSNNIELNREELRLLKHRPVMKVQVDAHLAPISFLGHDGKYKGIAIDYLDILAKKIGIEFDYFDPAIDKVNKKYYVDILATFNSEQYEAYNWLVSKAYVKFPYLLYAYKDKTPVIDIKNIKDKRLAVIRNHNIAGVLNREHSSQQFYLAKDTEDAIAALENNEADYFISDIITIKHYVDHNRRADLAIVGKTDYFYEAQLAVHADQRILFNLLKKVGASVEYEAMDSIVNKWTQDTVRKELDFSLLLKIIVAVAIVLLLFWYYSHRLRKMVFLRTNELLKANEMLEQSKEHYKDLYEKTNSMAKEKRNMEEQLYHVQKMDAIGKLAGGVAHDFNNILAVVFAQIHLIRIDIKKERPLNKRIEELETAASRATRLVEQLLLFSRKQETNFKYLNLNELIENLLKMVSRLLSENISFKFAPGKLMGSTLADHGQLEQVITNLCINARDAMPNGGTLTIASSSVDLRHVPETELIDAQPGRYNIFTVTDTGLGISDELKRRIFEPFFSTKETGKGTGLGLATVYSIVKSHGGFINVQSQVDKGTSFEIYLPVSEKEKDELVEGEKERIIRGKGQTILMAEDDENLRELAYELLIEHGYKVILATDGEQAIEHYQHYKNTIDLLLLDVVMPNKSGNEVYEYLKQVNAQVPVVFCSGYAFDKLEKLNLEEENVLFIKKPYKIDELLNSIAKVLNIS